MLAIEGLGCYGNEYQSVAFFEPYHVWDRHYELLLQYHECLQKVRYAHHAVYISYKDGSTSSIIGCLLWNTLLSDNQSLCSIYHIDYHLS
jgi:hypothetical protein